MVAASNIVGDLSYPDVLVVFIGSFSKENAAVMP
jgi:hypothetical protein